METCPSNQDLRDLLDGALDNSRRHALEAHVETCEHCQERLDHLPGDSAREIVRVLGVLPPASDVEPNGLDCRGTEPRASGGTQAEKIPKLIGKYAVVAKLGEGAEGEVFLVVHPRLARPSVLKRARRRLDSDSEVLHELEAEGRLLAELDHDALVKVLDLDVDDDGRPFLVMECVPGRTLEQLAESSCLDTSRSAKIVSALARAVAYLHSRGVVHLDIKPKNVLIDEACQPRLIDFGLSRLRHAWSDGSDDPKGGTLAYMAPEQARQEAERIGQRSDIFALGGVLYSLLTGRPPFTGASTAEIWDKAQRGDFDRSALRSAGVSRRLERICLRALATDPADRPATADELADALDRYVRLPRRLVGLAAAAALSIVTIGAWWACRPGLTTHDLDQPRTPILAKVEGHPIPEPPAPEQVALSGPLTIADGKGNISFSGSKHWANSQKPGDKSESELTYSGNLFLENLSGSIVQGNSSPKPPTPAKAISPPSSPSPTAVPAEPVSSDGDEDLPQPEMLLRIRHSGLDSAVAISPDGKQILTGSNIPLFTATSWDAQTGVKLRSFQGHKGSVSSVAFSPDGKQVLTGSWDKTAILWDAQTGEILRSFQGHTGWVTSVAFGPDGKLILTGSKGTRGSGEAILWETQTRQKRLPFSVSYVHSLAFSPDGKRFLVCSGRGVLAWEVPTGKPLPGVPPEPGSFLVATFRPDGKQILTGSWDNSATLWDTQTGEKLRSLRRHTGSVSAVAFSQDGKHILTGSDDGTAFLWLAQSGKSLQLIRPEGGGSIDALAFSTDGKKFLTGQRRAATLWKMPTGQGKQGH